MYLIIFAENDHYEVEINDLNYLHGNDAKYDFSSAILYKNGHFTSIIKDPKINKGGEFYFLNGLYYHDGMMFEGKIMKLDDSIKSQITEEKPIYFNL
ncbi:unnamed protein product [Blepharisma stoltei]|uniref:Uncharacterized protein n=1 Tax=Blepharisma stoltei TaxID=1481888 RepID=A0AAU9KPB2_9CILI|nr:unnamed protein product [Blepharisma stoltei]